MTEISALIKSLNSIISSTIRFKMDNTYWGVGCADEGQSSVKSTGLLRDIGNSG